MKVETETDNGQAGAVWAEGLRKFPDSALLPGKLAFYHLMKVWQYWSDDPVASIQQAERLAQEALSAPALSPQAVCRCHSWCLYSLKALLIFYDRSAWVRNAPKCRLHTCSCRNLLLSRPKHWTLRRCPFAIVDSINSFNWSRQLKDHFVIR